MRFFFRDEFLSSEFGVRSSEFGVRSSEFGVRSSEFKTSKKLGQNFPHGEMSEGQWGLHAARVMSFQVMSSEFREIFI
jgi:hypothetical protein